MVAAATAAEEVDAVGVVRPVLVDAVGVVRAGFATVVAAFARIMSPV